MVSQKEKANNMKWINGSSFNWIDRIKGLFYLRNFISEAEEQELLSNIDAQQWCCDLKRRTQHYGFKYDYTRKRVIESMRVGEIPEFLHPARKLVEPLFDKEPDQIIVNEYEPGQGISRHIDCIPCFGPVVASLTLQSPTTMRFSFHYSDTIAELLLEPRSLLLLEKDARYEWAHSIPKQKDSRRVSVTFRTVILS